MVRSRCTPIKLQISTHRSLSPTQRSLKADLSLCLCHQCSDLENLDQKSENLPCSTTRESMLMVPAKRGEKGLPLKLPGGGIIGLGIGISISCEILWSIMRQLIAVRPSYRPFGLELLPARAGVGWTQFLEIILQDSHHILTTMLPLLGGVMALRT